MFNTRTCARNMRKIWNVQGIYVKKELVQGIYVKMDMCKEYFQNKDMCKENMQ